MEKVWEVKTHGTTLEVIAETYEEAVYIVENATEEDYVEGIIVDKSWTDEDYRLMRELYS